MYHINIIGNIISDICEDLQLLLEDDFNVDVVRKYIEDIKSIAHIEGYYIYTPNTNILRSNIHHIITDEDYSIDIELYFNNYDERFTINFKRKFVNEHWLCTSSLKGRKIILSKPLSTKIEGMLHCEGVSNVKQYNEIAREKWVEKVIVKICEEYYFVKDANELKNTIRCFCRDYSLSPYLFKRIFEKVLEADDINSWMQKIKLF